MHAVIACADVRAVRAGDVTSASQKRLDAVELLESVVRAATDVDHVPLEALRHVLPRIDEVSDRATFVRPEDAARVRERLQHLGDWAERRYAPERGHDVLRRRPPVPRTWIDTRGNCPCRMPADFDARRAAADRGRAAWAELEAPWTALAMASRERACSDRLPGPCHEACHGHSDETGPTDAESLPSPACTRGW